MGFAEERDPGRRQTGAAPAQEGRESVRSRSRQHSPIGTTMEEATPRGSFTAEQLALVRRQISMWENNRDDVGAAADWCADGELTAPRGVRVAASDIADTIRGWHEILTDLHVELTALFASPDGDWLAIEWSWHCTRRRDMARSTTPDAIVVELRDGRIASWREYFDTFGSIEFE